MIDIQKWMDAFLRALNAAFANRVCFVGLQGSYGRGEATKTSDIDVVVVLDELSCRDIQAYDRMLDSLPHRELVCGFLSGKEELLHWEPSDLFQFCYDTTPVLGSLEEVVSLLDESAVKRAIKIGACNLYHGCVHNMLHEKSEEMLRGLYKAASFVVQAIVFWQKGSYAKHQKELLALADFEERAILSTFWDLKNGGDLSFFPMSEALVAFAKKWIVKSETAREASHE